MVKLNALSIRDDNFIDLEALSPPVLTQPFKVHIFLRRLFPRAKYQISYHRHKSRT